MSILNAFPYTFMHKKQHGSEQNHQFSDMQFSCQKVREVLYLMRTLQHNLTVRLIKMYAQYPTLSLFIIALCLYSIQFKNTYCQKLCQNVYSLAQL